MNCPAWAKLSKDMPSGPASSAAQRGTMLHSVAELCVNDMSIDPLNLTNASYDGVEFTEELSNSKVIPALDAVAELEEKHDVEFQTEVLMQIADDVGGTADLIAFNKETDVFIMADFKFGDGYLVYADQNQQLLFYTMLAVKHYEADFMFTPNTKFIGAIIQPSERKEELLDTWEFTFQELESFIKRFETQYASAKNRNTPPVAGKWCSWCPAEAVCPAKTGTAHQALRLPTNSMELTKLNEAMQIVDDIESWVKAVRKLAHEQAEAGVKIEGFKLVAKRAMRVWNEPTSIERKVKLMKKLVADEYYVQKLKSPAQLEKICKQKGVDFKQFSSYISSVSSGTTLVTETDKRPAIVPVAALAALASSIK